MSKPSTPTSMDNTLAVRTVQSDMCKGHADGAIGIIVSGAVWLLSAIVAYKFSASQAIWTLLIGGALIHPVATMIEKLTGLKGHQKGNPLKNLAMEGTVWMIMCLPLAYALSFIEVEWFFQAMLMIIGGRYLTFATLYGKKSYWILGALLGTAAYVLFGLEMNSFFTLLTGFLIEMIFGLFILLRFRKIYSKDEIPAR